MGLLSYFRRNFLWTPEFEGLREEAGLLPLPDSDEAITDRMVEITEQYNELWRICRERKIPLKPWVNWETKTLLLLEATFNQRILAPQSEREEQEQDLVDMDD